METPQPIHSKIWGLVPSTSIDTYDFTYWNVFRLQDLDLQQIVQGKSWALTLHAIIYIDDLSQFQSSMGLPFILCGVTSQAQVLLCGESAFDIWDSACLGVQLPLTEKPGLSGLVYWADLSNQSAPFCNIVDCMWTTWSRSPQSGHILVCSWSQFVQL